MYENSAAATIGRAAIVVLMLFSYPLQAHPCRGSLDKIFSWRPTHTLARPSTPPNSKTAPSQIRFQSPLLQLPSNVFSDARFAILTALILTASYSVAMTVASLDRV